MSEFRRTTLGAVTRAVLTSTLATIVASGCEQAPTTVEWRGHSFQEVRTLAAVPPAIRLRLGADRPGAEGVADRGRPFSVTDVNHDLPMRRFLVAGKDGDTWLLALERGGRSYNVEALLFPVPEGPPKQTWILPERPKTLRDVVLQLPRS